MLKPNTSTASSETTQNEPLNEALVKSTIELRKNWLEEIKPKITLKAYYAMEEKISAEEKRLTEILDWQTGKKSHLAKYSFILDSRFFEQELMN